MGALCVSTGRIDPVWFKSNAHVARLTSQFNSSWRPIHPNASICIVTQRKLYFFFGAWFCAFETAWSAVAPRDRNIAPGESVPLDAGAKICFFFVRARSLDNADGDDGDDDDDDDDVDDDGERQDKYKTFHVTPPPYSSFFFSSAASLHFVHLAFIANHTRFSRTFEVQVAWATFFPFARHAECANWDWAQQWLERRDSMFHWTSIFCVAYVSQFYNFLFLCFLPRASLRVS